MSVLNPNLAVDLGALKQANESGGLAVGVGSKPVIVRMNGHHIPAMEFTFADMAGKETKVMIPTRMFPPVIASMMSFQMELDMEQEKAHAAKAG